MASDIRTWSPLWLEFSGLPEDLADKPNGAAAWAVFKKAVELDCAANSSPGTVEIVISELAGRTALKPPAARKGLLLLRRLKLMACFLPDSDEEAALVRVQVPLPTPRTREQIAAAWPAELGAMPASLRYLDVAAEQGDETAGDGSDTVLQEIVDLYFNTVGLKMNAFVLDELRLVRQRFPIEAVRRVFRRAQQNEIHSLQWVVRQLARAGSKDAEEKH